MSHKSKESLIYQIKKAFDSLDCTGQSKHDAKDEHGHVDGVYSYETMSKYKSVCCRFVKWCKERHGCKTLKEFRKYGDEWIEGMIGTYSASTIKQYASAVAKMYQCSTKEFIKTPSRYRADIKRSRGEKVRDAHFSEGNHKVIVDFCKSVGLRRHELEAIKKDDLYIIDGEYYVHVRRGKGGKERYAKVIGDVKNVIDCFSKAENNPNGKVFPKIPNAMDVHGYRRVYADTYYRMIARNGIPRSDRYICRKDKAGIVYVKNAMLTVSRSLGHNRIDVIAQSYLD